VPSDTDLILVTSASGRRNVALEATNASSIIAQRVFVPGLLVAILAWGFGVMLFEASKKLFWYDEIVTFHISGLQPFSLLLSALKAGADAQPLGYYLIARAANMLPGNPLVTLRLPSILGYVMTLLGVYWFVRKRLPAIAGLAAALLIALSPLRAFALDARPYALLVGFFAISAVLWQRIGEKRFMTPLFALFLTLAVSCHAYAVVATSFFAIAELAWTFRSRRIRWRVWAACLLATTPFVIDIPFLLHFRDVYGKNYWAHPGWRRAFTTYGYYIGAEINRNFPFIHSPQSVLLLFFGLGAGYWLLRSYSSQGTKRPSPTSPYLRSSWSGALRCTRL
jgi:4-amino-4-deoxy-L-arabinose transferase-like glycosyltransferase